MRDQDFERPESDQSEGLTSKIQNPTNPRPGFQNFKIWPIRGLDFEISQFWPIRGLDFGNSESDQLEAWISKFLNFDQSESLFWTATINYLNCSNERVHTFFTIFLIWSIWAILIFWKKWKFSAAKTISSAKDQSDYQTGMRHTVWVID